MKTAELSISIVDDDEMFLKALKHSLQEKLKDTIRIKQFHTGEDFLKDLSRERSDIVILDYILNNSRPYAMDGRSVLQKIKQTDPDVTVIMLSGQNKIEVALESIRDGAYDYVIKNDTVFLKMQTIIKKAVKSVLDSKRSRKYNSWMIGAGICIGIGAIVALLFNILF